MDQQLSGEDINMAKIVEGLFGLTPSQVEQKQAMEQEKRATMLAGLAQPGFGQLSYGISNLGYGLGRAAGQLLGIEDPELTKAKDMEVILSNVTDSLSSSELSNPTLFFPRVIEELSQAGYAKEASEISRVASDEISSWNKRQAEIRKINKEAEEAGKPKTTKTKLQQAEEWLNTLVVKKAALEKEGASKDSIDRIDEQINNAQDAIKLLTTQKKSTYTLLAEAIQVINNPQSHSKEELDQAMATYERLLPMKSSQGEYEGKINPESGKIELTPIKGSEAYNEKLESFDKIIDGFSIRTEKLIPTVDTIDDVLKKIDDPNSGLAFGPEGFAKSFLLGTAEYNLNKNEIKTILANVGFKELQEMRDLSRTGGALGQVAVKEIDFLQATLGALNVGLPRAEFKKNVQKIKASYVRLINTWNKMIAEAKANKKKLVGETAPEVKEASSPSSSFDLLMDELNKRQPTSPDKE